MDLDISFDVSGQMIMGNDETIGELYEKTKLRYLRFYLISKYKNDSDYDSSLPDIRWSISQGHLLQQTLAVRYYPCVVKHSVINKYLSAEHIQYSWQ